MGWGLRIKKFVYYGGSLENLFLGLVHKKTIYRQYIRVMSKNGGLGQFSDLRGGLATKRGWCF